VVGGPGRSSRNRGRCAQRGARELARGSGAGPLHTFSGRFPELLSVDEGGYIEAVLAGGGLSPTMLLPGRTGPLAPSLQWAQPEDEPIDSSAATLYCGIFEAAAGTGIRVVLDGDGGDEVVGHGQARLVELLDQRRWREWAHEVRIQRGLRGERWSATARREAVSPLLPPAVRSRWRRLRHGRRSPWLGAPPINPAFAAEMRVHERAAEMPLERAFAARTARAEHVAHLESGLDATVLGIQERHAAMSGIEPRYPFFDRRLVEFCVALPAEQKLASGWGRVVARRAMPPPLPESVAWRVPKSDRGPAFHPALVAHDLPLPLIPT